MRKVSFGLVVYFLATCVFLLIPSTDSIKSPQLPTYVARWQGGEKSRGGEYTASFLPTSQWIFDGQQHLQLHFALLFGSASSLPCPSAALIAQPADLSQLLWFYCLDDHPLSSLPLLLSQQFLSSSSSYSPSYDPSSSDYTSDSASSSSSSSSLSDFYSFLTINNIIVVSYEENAWQEDKRIFLDALTGERLPTQSIRIGPCLSSTTPQPASLSGHRKERAASRRSQGNDALLPIDEKEEQQEEQQEEEQQEGEGEGEGEREREGEKEQDNHFNDHQEIDNDDDDDDQQGNRGAEWYLCAKEGQNFYSVDTERGTIRRWQAGQASAQQLKEQGHIKRLSDLLLLGPEGDDVDIKAWPTLLMEKSIINITFEGPGLGASLGSGANCSYFAIEGPLQQQVALGRWPLTAQGDNRAVCRTPSNLTVGAYQVLLQLEQPSDFYLASLQVLHPQHSDQCKKCFKTALDCYTVVNGTRQAFCCDDASPRSCTPTQTRDLTVFKWVLIGITAAFFVVIVVVAFAALFIPSCNKAQTTYRPIPSANFEQE